MLYKRNPQLNKNGELIHLLSIEGLPKAVLTQIHDYDLAWWLLGPFARVTASGGHLSDLEIDVEDTIDARLEGGAAPVQRHAANDLDLVDEGLVLEVDAELAGAPHRDHRRCLEQQPRQADVHDANRHLPAQQSHELDGLRADSRIAAHCVSGSLLGPPSPMGMASCNCTS